MDLFKRNELVVAGGFVDKYTLRLSVMLCYTVRENIGVEKKKLKKKVSYLVSVTIT